MKLLLRPNILAYIVSPLISALIFYALVVFRLKTGNYLPGIRILFLIFAIPFSYLGVVIFGLPSLALVKKMQIVNYFSMAILGFTNGILTMLLPVTIVLIAKKISIKEVYGNMLEPILAAGIAGLVGILIFALISDKGIRYE